MCPTSVALTSTITVCGLVSLNFSSQILINSDQSVCLVNIRTNSNLGHIDIHYLLFFQHFFLRFVKTRDYLVKVCHLAQLFTKAQNFRLVSLPNDKILDWSKLKAYADDKINVTEKLKFVLGSVENIVGKGENAGYQHFLIFPQCFQRLLIEGR